jgi:hypothetical protein
VAPRLPLGGEGQEVPHKTRSRRRRRKRKEALGKAVRLMRLSKGSETLVRPARRGGERRSRSGWPTSVIGGSAARRRGGTGPLPALTRSMTRSMKRKRKKRKASSRKVMCG